MIEIEGLLVPVRNFVSGQAVWGLEDFDRLGKNLRFVMSLAFCVYHFLIVQPSRYLDPCTVAQPFGGIEGAALEPSNFDCPVAFLVYVKPRAGYVETGVPFVVDNA